MAPICSQACVQQPNMPMRIAPQGRPPPAQRLSFAPSPLLLPPSAARYAGKRRSGFQIVALAWPNHRSQEPRRQAAQASSSDAAQTALLDSEAPVAISASMQEVASSLDELYGAPSAPESPDGTAAVSSVADDNTAIFGMSEALQGMLLLNLGAALFGSNMVAIKAAEDSMSSTALSATRFAIAALAFAPYLYRGLQLPKVRRSAVELALWLFGGYTAQAAGLEMTTAARGAFTGTFTVVAVPLLVGLSGRKVPWTTWAAAVVALGGVGLLTSSGADPNWGDALCILSATLFGVHKWRSESVTAQIDETTELVAVQLGLLAVTSAAVTIPEIWSSVQGQDAAHIASSVAGLPWAALLFMGLGTTALTLFIEMKALRSVSSPVAAIIYTAEPLWGAGLAYWLLGERWGPLGWVGAALIIGSSLASQLTGDKMQHVSELAEPDTKEA